MTSVQHAVRTTLLGFILGTGLLLGGAAVAAAAPGDSGVSSGSSSADSGPSAPSGRTTASPSGVAARTSSSTAKRPPVKPVATPRGNRPTVTKPAVVRGVVDEPVEPTRPTEPVVFGNPGQNQEYFASRNWETARLMSATMVLRQLTGAMVDPQDLVDQAISTNSRYRTGRTVYLGPGKNDSVWANDVQELLSDRSVEVVTRQYPRAQESRALTNLQTALQDPHKAVMVDVSTPLDGWDKPHTHEVVVLGIDATNGRVYLNDAWSPTTGKGKTMTLTDFLAAWANNYSTTIAQLPAALRRDPMASVEAIAA